MKIIYKVSYLSNGTKVKITNELFNQLKKWEVENADIPNSFLDELKMQDDEWINNYRNYYLKNTSLNTLINLRIDLKSSVYTTNQSVEQICITREAIANITVILEKCTIIQKRRFIKHFVHKLSYSEIAIQENVSKIAVQKSINKVLKLL